MLASEIPGGSTAHGHKFRNPNVAAVRPERDLPAPVFFRAGSEIYAEGDACGKLYRVAFGCVRVYRLLSDGRRQISAFHLPGEVFGFEAGKERRFFAEAVCDSGIQILSTGSGSEEMANELLPMALQCLLRAEDHLMMLGRQNAMERIASFLLEMAEQQGEQSHIELPMTRSDIADYLGLTIETVSRAFSTLKRRGVIRLTGLRGVDIVQRQALTAMACH